MMTPRQSDWLTAGRNITLILVEFEVETEVEVQVQIKLRPMVSLPLCLGVGLPSWDRKIASGSYQRGHSRIQVSQSSLPDFTFSFGVGVLLAADSQSTSKSGYRASLWDPWPDFIFFFFFHLTITLFCFQCVLWRENGSVVYSVIAL
jgi:hypothetical protein